MRNFLYTLILPFTVFPFVLFTLLIALGNFLYFYSDLNYEIEGIALLNILWVGFYMYVYVISISKEY